MLELLCLVLACALPQGSESALAPPGCARVKGGKTIIGSTPDEILALLEEAPHHHEEVRALDAETPQHEVPVADFHMMVTEVTNEQYLAFVRASGFRPPLLWADHEALAEARAAHGRLEAEAIELAKREHRKPPDPVPFDEAEWWETAWNDRPWAMPDSLALVPVVYVDHEEALAYGRWAGMRLPTEPEFQRAARGDTRNPYPWGKEWQPRSRRTDREAGAEEVRAATSEAHLNAPTRVGSYPAGATELGIFDLVGNVWEWTSSPYTAFEGFEANEYELGRDVKLGSAPRWDADVRVAVGGSYGQDRWIGRVTVRRDTPPEEKAMGLGFRCVASPRPGIDVAEAILRSEVEPSPHLPDGRTYAVAQTVALDRWLVSASNAEGAPPGYQVIEGYRYFVFTPVEALGESQTEAFFRASLASPEHLGFFSTSETLLEPVLEPGTYLLAYRAAGPTREPDAVDPRIDTSRENFLFLDPRTGDLAAIHAVQRCEFDKESKPQGFGFAPETVWEPVTDAQGEETRVQRTEQRLVLDATIQSGLRARVLRIGISFRVPPEVEQAGWRR